MREHQVDVAIIGAGTAGLNARRAVEERGGRPMLIEAGPYGTTCARVGCMPSKLLIAAADAAEGVRGATLFGISAVPRVDGAAVMGRVQRERDRYVDSTIAGIDAIPPDQRLTGRARLLGPTTVAVGTEAIVHARAVVIATGSTPFVPPPFAAIRHAVLTSDDIFELPDLPESVAVIGTGVIALELGQAMHRLGVRTAFFSPFEDLGPLSDPEVLHVARRDLGAELDLRQPVEMLAATPETGGVRLRWREASGTEREESFARILVAAGRRPAVGGLDLAAAGLALGPGGLPATDPKTAQCGDAPVFLAGDVAGHRPLQHEAADEGRIAGDNAMRWPEVRRHRRRTPLGIAFTDPQIAILGLRHAELDPARHLAGAASYDTQGRARAMGVNRGLMRLYAETASCRLVGGEMAGPGMEHMAQLVAWAIEQGMTVPQALSMPYYHPVLETGIRTALRDLAKKLGALGQCRPEDLEESPGQ